MASTTNVILGAAAALILWTVVGLAVARAVLPARTLMWPVAPILGWAVHSAATLPLFMLVGFNRTTVAIVMVLSLAAGAYGLWRQPASPGHDKDATAVPAWAWLGALILALGPTAAILPKFADGAVVLSGPIFDHAKVAMVDEICRENAVGETPAPQLVMFTTAVHEVTVEHVVQVEHVVSVAMFATLSAATRSRPLPSMLSR